MPTNAAPLLNPVMKHHEVVDLFPRLTGRDRDEVKESIRTFGVKESVEYVMHPRHGKCLIDGANRRELAEELGILCPEREYLVPDGQGGTRVPTDAEILDYVMVRNKDRRHLNSSQLAAISVRAGALQRKYAQKARRGMRTSPRADQAPPEAQEPSAEGAPGAAAEQAPEANGATSAAPPGPPPEDLQGDQASRVAAQAGTNRAYLFKAVKIQEEDPDLLRRVAMGELSLEAAAKQLRERNQPAAAPEGEPQPTLDTLGRHVPRRLKAVFEAVAHYREAIQLASRIKGLIKQIKEGPAAVFLDATEVNAWAQNLYTSLKHAAPHSATCPYCQGEGKTPDPDRDGRNKKCTACQGVGWCDYQHWRDAPEELQQAVLRPPAEEAPAERSSRRRRQEAEPAQAAE
jgi:hypothetical protein